MVHTEFHTTMSSLTRNAFVRLTNRRILQIQGIDALRFVQAILTNDMRTMDKPSSAIYGAFLNTKGRVLGDCNVVQVKVSNSLQWYVH